MMMMMMMMMKCINTKISLSLSLTFRYIYLCDKCDIKEVSPIHNIYKSYICQELALGNPTLLRGEKAHLCCTECIVLESVDAPQSELCHKPKYFSSFLRSKISFSPCQKKCRCFQLISGTFLFCFGSRLS